MAKKRIAVHGAAGRMGRRLIALAKQDPELELVAAIDAPGHPDIGRDSGELAGIGPNGVLISGRFAGSAQIDAVIDFSKPDALDELLQTCVQRKLPLVYATTGATADQLQKLKEVAATIPVLWSPSMSLTVNLAMMLSKLAAGALANKDADVEIIEKHHRFKTDAPSGTALKFGRIIAERMGITESVHGRVGKPGERPHNQIGYHAVRIGDNPGEHTILFGLLGETLEITVKATSRDAYAVGALECAKFLAGQPAGKLYTMNDVLKL